MQKESLEIIKRNKILQKRLDKHINDYKNYFEFYSSIEIELIPSDNKYDKFINIPKEGKEYYHIYFDNSNEEIKRNYLEKNERIKKIKIITIQSPMIMMFIIIEFLNSKLNLEINI